MGYGEGSEAAGVGVAMMSVALVALLLYAFWPYFSSACS